MSGDVALKRRRVHPRLLPFRGTILRVANTALAPFGIELARKGQRPSLSTHDRLRHAAHLGFSPQTIFDCGAHNGAWATEARTIFTSAHLVLIEPNPTLMPSLQSTVDRLANATAVGKALAAERGRMTLNVWGGSAGASLLPHAVGRPERSYEVEVDTLDAIAASLTAAPDLIKLDLQGAELSALQGASDSLARAEMVVTEFGCFDAYVGRASPRQLFDYLYGAGFRLYDICQPMYRPHDGALGAGDFIFVKSTSKLVACQAWR